ncbi:FKBP-type peptidyl-prolyl cis-trans isomerase [Sphingobacterium sp. SYP-B4668]|uniref:FKBP-type peptidyl-prolyl cis-trans isomerase n=1 Tax=Sphingobacterium sp. SYP-B4668 TaxID=2996035 RepID=UPI0022DDBB12|nr:FKBP-type peptidyl-prolyl cis-trans isomerase [Sphingobacterium sp. SYP-B4668]
MKNVLRLIAIGLVGTFIFTSCNKGDDFDWNKYEEEQRREQARIDSTLNAQKKVLKDFVEDPDNGFTNPQLDDSTGIWYQVITEGEASSYTYAFNSQGTGIVAPNVTVKFKGTFLDGKVAEQTEADKTTVFQLGSRPLAWHKAFLPRAISFNNQEVKVGGLTVNGLKKNSKIRFVAPSIYCFDKGTTLNGVTIPKDSPLVYVIEVTDIKNTN